MVRWSAAKEGKILCSLFESGMADPRYSKPAEIDPIKNMKEEFEPFTDQIFRKNYKNTATSWMTAKSLTGLRRKDLLNCEFVHVIPCCFLWLIVSNR